jgi:hypothetical protein
VSKEGGGRAQKYLKKILSTLLEKKKKFSFPVRMCVIRHEKQLYFFFFKFLLSLFVKKKKEPPCLYFLFNGLLSQKILGFFFRKKIFF